MCILLQFVHSSVNKHLDCFWFDAIVSKAGRNICEQDHMDINFHYSWIKYLSIEWVGLYGIYGLCLIF